MNFLSKIAPITINGYGDPDSGFDFISVFNDIMKVTVCINRAFMKRGGKTVDNPNYGFVFATARFLKVPGAIATIDSETLNWKYRVNLKEEHFDCAKVIEIMAKGRLLYERLSSLFNTPLEYIK